jgi:DNA-binding HxlR family transcriptional regulator
LRWAWFGGFRTWDAAVRSLARTLRGLERADLIERRTLRTDRGQPVRRILTLTAHGHEVTALLSGRADSGELAP